jgi:hypothetical protein
MQNDWKIWEIFLNKTLISALVAMLSVQVLKVFSPVFKGKPPNLKRLTDYGGMPSGHSAFIGAVVTASGIFGGWSSPVFAVAGVLASVMIYDILKLRRVVEANLKTTNELMEKGEVKPIKGIPQFKGHSPAEVIAGIIWGVVCAVVVGIVWA